MRGSVSFRYHVMRHSDEKHVENHSDVKPFKCDMCPYATKQEIHLRIHRRSHDDKREKHACPVCDVKLASKGGLKSHLIRHMGGGKHKCALCLKTFPFPSTLKYHIAFVHEKIAIAKPFKCEVCEMAFKSRPDLEMHKTRHSEERKFECSFCDKKFKCKYSLRNHEKKIHLKQRRTVSCATCGMQLGNKSALRRHLEVHKPESERTRYRCDSCEKTFTGKSGLRQHQKTHETEKPHKCLKCGKAFHQKAVLEQHLLVHSDERPFKCKLCKKGFKALCYLNIHMRRHGSKRDFKCSMCSATFKTSSDLAGHVVFHRTERKHACEQCSAKFFTAKLLRNHMLTHSEIREFACHYCTYKSKKKFQLKCHEETHLAPEHRQQFSCSQCEMTYATKVGLRRHKRTIHATSLSRLQCEKCQKYFLGPDALNSHRKCCHKEKKFACEKCGAVFSIRYRLDRHMKVHSHEKPFQCHVCLASFKHRELLKSHSRVHGSDGSGPSGLWLWNGEASPWQLAPVMSVSTFHVGVSFHVTHWARCQPPDLSVCRLDFLHSFMLATFPWHM